MFGKEQDSITKLSTLEAKFDIYEELSKAMIDKIESAVEKISDSNAKIAAVLNKHDERIDQTIKNDETLSRKIEYLETQMNNLSKFRWTSMGILLAFVTLVQIVQSGILTIGIKSDKMSVHSPSPYELPG